MPGAADRHEGGKGTVECIRRKGWGGHPDADGQVITVNGQLDGASVEAHDGITGGGEEAVIRLVGELFVEPGRQSIELSAEPADHRGGPVMRDRRDRDDVLVGAAPASVSWAMPPSSTGAELHDSDQLSSVPRLTAEDGGEERKWQVWPCVTYDRGQRAQTEGRTNGAKVSSLLFLNATGLHRYA